MAAAKVATTRKQRPSRAATTRGTTAAGATRTKAAAVAKAEAKSTKVSASAKTASVAKRTGIKAGATPAANSWLQDVTDAITSVTSKTHSMQLYEMMGMRAHSKMRPYLFGVLSRIRELQPVRVSDVAQQMDYERSTVSRHVAELTELGCVERMANPDDGRVVILRLTPKGQRMIDKVYDAWLTSLSQITSDWSVADRKTFLRLLLRFDQSFTEYFADQD